MSKVSTCLWFGQDAEMAVRFYVSIVPGSSLKHVQRSPGAWPGGAAGDVVLLTFTLGGQSFQAFFWLSRVVGGIPQLSNGKSSET